MQLDREILLRDRFRTALVEGAKLLTLFIREGEVDVGRIELRDLGEKHLLRLDEHAHRR